MSGLYSQLMGDGREVERGKTALMVLGVMSFGRFRDAWVERGQDGKPVFAIYTRNGGGNRENWAETIGAMQANEHYLRDADDTFDSTYATFYFRVPVEWHEALAQVMIEPVDMSAKWLAAIDAIGGSR